MRNPVFARHQIPGILMIVIIIVITAISPGCVQTDSGSPVQNATQTIIPATPVVTATIPETTATPYAETALNETQNQTTPAPTPTPEYTKYTSENYGFSIDYPSDWEENPTNQLLTDFSSVYRDVEFYSPTISRCNTEKTECVNVRAEVSVDVDTAPGTKELDTYYVKDVARLTGEYGIEITKKDSLFKLAGVKAYRLDYHQKDDVEDINVLRAYTLIGGNVYIITYHAHAPKSGEINQFEQYYNNAMAMFKSFSAKGAVKTI